MGVQRSERDEARAVLEGARDVLRPELARARTRALEQGPERGPERGRDLGLGLGR